MLNQIIVIKMGGEIISNADTLHLLCKAMHPLKQAKTKIVIIHGGGQQVNQFENKLGHRPHIVNGRRITDEAALDAVKMVIAGKINIDIVSALQSQGIHAVGLSGVDARLLKVSRRPCKTIDYGLVGDINAVDPTLIYHLLEKDFVPVIAPLAADDNGSIYNINADSVASAIALSLKAAQWLILTNIDGVYDENGTTLSHLTCKQARQLITEEVIKNGMAPKMEAILSAIENGLPSVCMINGFKPEKLTAWCIDNLCLDTAHVDAHIDTLRVDTPYFEKLGFGKSLGTLITNEGHAHEC